MIEIPSQMFVLGRLRQTPRASSVLKMAGVSAWTLLFAHGSGTWVPDEDRQQFDQAVAVYSVPGEEFVPELENSIDLIVSINALDHGYDIAQSIRNLKRYLKPEGEAFLSFDMHDEPDYMHPLVLSNELMLGIYAEAGFEVVKVESARRYHGAEGPGAFHYWLRHAPAAG